MVLKRAGFSLADIVVLLQREGSGTALIEARIVALRRELATRSAALAAREEAWQKRDSVTRPDLNQLLENIQMSEKLDMHVSATEAAQLKQRGQIMDRYFSDGEREQLRQRAARFGMQNMQHYGTQWSQLIAAVRTAMDAGKPPNNAEVIELAHRWHGLVNSFSGGDDALARKLKTAYNENPQMMHSQGMDASMFAYIGDAMQAAGLAES